ncbi:hypothetical protein L7F22_009386 [Adiantum nelumboides]|nr:hypothetical protein [Adiantum nelumboides]
MSAIPIEEQPILESLINIRNRLTALKKDSSTYVKPQDVQQLYQAVIKQVSRLNTVRDESTANDTGDSKRPSRTGEGSNVEADHTVMTEINRVDTTLNDVFSLLSLFFLTIGKSRETPATFCQLASMKQLLGHLAESGIYTEQDLQPFSHRLSELRAIIKRDAEQGKHPVQLTKLMMKKIEGCEKVLRTLEGTLSVLSVELVPIHQRLISIRRQLIAAAAKPKLTRHEMKHEIKALQEELRKIDSKRVDGKFLGPGGSSVPAGQAILVGILEDCFEILHEINVRNDEVPMTLQPIYDRLSEIRSQLEHLVLTHRWTLRETDLWNYQVTLKEIDRLRVDGKFVDSEGKQPEGQLVVLYLLRRCYGLIYRLIASSEPISEELMPISNKLSTISKCLKEVSKYGGPFTMRDLYPYRLALHQIDAMRNPVKDKDGNDSGVKKWLGRDGSVPEGQAILRAQYEEVEQTINEMLNRDDDDDDDGEEVEDDEEYDGSVADSSNDEYESGIESAASGLSPDLAENSFPGSPGSPMGEVSQDYMQSSMMNLIPPNISTVGTDSFLSSEADRTLDSERTPTAASSVHANNTMPPHDGVSTMPVSNSLPLGAAPLAATPGSYVAPPAPHNVPVISGMTARPGQPANELTHLQMNKLVNQCESTDTMTPTKASMKAMADNLKSNEARIDEDEHLRGSLDASEVHKANGNQPISSIDALAAQVGSDLRINRPDA